MSASTGDGSARVPPRNKRGLRTGFTTGACSAAAARAAVRALLTGAAPSDIETLLPNGQRVAFRLERCVVTGARATAGVIKDAGDDPDCTHGAELVAEVELLEAPGIELLGGEGIATVTRPGLGLEVGGPAINPVPRRNIADNVRAELALGEARGARITLHVPGGEELARHTTNARLGLVGGISILGTTGIVRPYSTAAYKASVVQAIDVARARGHREVALTTGGKTEQYAIELLPHLPEECFVQMGDFVGVAVRRCARAGLRRAHLVGMIGKLSKMADGRMQTHAAGSQVNTALLADLAAEAGVAAELCREIAEAPTARRALELCGPERIRLVGRALCRRAAEHCRRHAGELEVHAHLVDFDGRLLASVPHPPRIEDSRP